AAKATVRVQPSKPGPAYVELTSSDGKFAIEQMPAGAYTITAQRPGTESARVIPASQTVVIGVDATRTVELHLKPFAVISGNILDADGDPVPNASLSLMRPSYIRGAATLEPIPFSATVDDRGMFRMIVAGGRYYLRASGGGIVGTRATYDIRGRSAQQEN